MKIVLSILLLTFFCFAKDYKLVFSESTPPFVFKDGSGIVQTIVKEALAYKGHTVTPVFVNIGRGFEMFKHGYVDGSTIIQESSGLQAYYTKDYMQYHNAVFALKDKNISVNSLDDVTKYYSIAFQNANKYLGEAFGKVAEKAGKKYSEVADQKQQVYMFFKGRTEIVIMDRHIFKFYRNQLISEGKISKDTAYVLFELFEPTKYKTAFLEEKARDDFNEGIDHLKSSGRYEKIYEEYSDKYFEVKK